MNILPKKVQINIISGICNIDYIMCNVHDLNIKKIMDSFTFNKIIDNLLKYKKYFEQVALVGVGEIIMTQVCK